MGAGSQQPNARLVADFDASAGEQRDAPVQIRRLGALAEIQIGAFRAKLVVEMVEGRVVLLADIAVLRLDLIAKIRVIFDLARLDGRGRQGIGRGEHRAAAQFPDAGLIEDALFPLQFLDLALAYPGFDKPAPLSWVGQEDIARGPEQPGVFFRGKRRQQRAVGGRFFHDLDGGAQLFSCVFSVHLGKIVPADWP